MCAAELKHWEIAKLLVDRGANMHIANNQGETLFAKIKKYENMINNDMGNTIKILALLFENGAHVRDEDAINLASLLQLAQKIGDEETVELLQKYMEKLDVNE